MIGPMAPESASTTENTTGIMRLMIAMPATASVPYLAISRVTMAAPTGVAMVASTAGAAICMPSRMS